MNVTVVVATFGANVWRDLAEHRAVPSAEAQGVPVVVEHGATLHDARNDALGKVETEWVIHLDADDQLAPGYVDAMRDAHADIRVPTTARPHPRRAGEYQRQPRHWQVKGHTHACHADCLPFGNWVPVGACAPTALLREVGGWRDWPMFEDWDLWLRCYKAGASFEPVPAVYVNHRTPGSRNHPADPAARDDAHLRIALANGYHSNGSPILHRSQLRTHP